jgi:capsular polysaccharide biosynthesis protein
MEPTKSTRQSPEQAATVVRGRPPIRARGVNYVSLGRSAAAHLYLILAVAVFGMVLGGLYGVARHPVYSAEARLLVGKSVTITNEAAAAGIPAAEAQFADTYSRLANTEAVTADVEKRLKSSLLGGSLSASPIPDSPVIRVNATGPSQAAALALGNAGAQAIIDQVDAINQSNQATLNQLLTEYTQVEVKLQEDSDLQGSLQAQLNAANGNSPTLQAEYNKAKADQATDIIEANALQAQYNNQYSPVQSDAAVVTLVSDAAFTGSDKSKYMEMGVLGGLVGGIIVGIALAALIDLRRRAPRLTPIKRPD